MAELETFPCHDCNGTGERNVIRSWTHWGPEPCEKCEGTGKCPVCRDLAEIKWLDMDVED